MEKTEYINHSIKKIRTPRKSIGVAIFWGLGLLLAAVLVRHHNPLADQVTEQMKKVSGCVLIAFTCIIFTIFYERILTIPAELFQSRKMIWKLSIDGLQNEMNRKMESMQCETDNLITQQNQLILENSKLRDLQECLVNSKAGHS